MPDKYLQSELYIFFTKIIIPAFVAVGVKVAIEMKTNKVKTSIFNVILSIIIGVGGAYLTSGIIQKECSIETVPAVVALVAIMSEKIGQWIIYKLNLDNFLTALADVCFDFILNLRNKK